MGGICRHSSEWSRSVDMNRINDRNSHERYNISIVELTRAADITLVDDSKICTPLEAMDKPSDVICESSDVICKFGDVICKPGDVMLVLHV